jgi:hypothetical protein
MPNKEWATVHNACKIRVTNAWTGGAKLYIDGDCRDTNNDMFASVSSPALSARVTTADGGSFLVEVFMKALTTVKAKICVNGAQVGGDAF